MLDPHARHRVRFTQLDAEAQTRLRTIYHLTSAQAALAIARSGYIWSNDPDGCPNFSVHRDPRVNNAALAEVALAFKFDGPVLLHEARADFSAYEPGSLNLHLSSWPTLYGMDGLRVSVARVAAGTVNGLDCVNFKLTPAFIDKCKTDPEAELLLRRLRRQLALGRSIKVPRSLEERQQVEARAVEAEPQPTLAKSLWNKLRGRPSA